MQKHRQTDRQTDRQKHKHRDSDEYSIVVFCKKHNYHIEKQPLIITSFKHETAQAPDMQLWLPPCLGQKNCSTVAVLVRLLNLN